MREYIFICEDSLEGIFTGIYDAWASKYGHDNCRLQVGEEENLVLFAEYIIVKSDNIRAGKVLAAIYQKMGEEAYTDICRAAAAIDSGKAEAIYKTLVEGLSSQPGRKIMGHLSNPHIMKVFELSRRVGNEAHHLLGFIRFKELESGVLFSEIGPKSDVLTLIAPHFADRLPRENFMIYDAGRQACVIHQADGPWVLVSGECINQDIIGKYSKKEEFYQELFKGFCKSISIKERENLLLQRQMLPLRFQKFMLEF